jgi:hypothetical protein
VRPLLTLTLAGCLCLLVASLAACSSGSSISKHVTLSTVAPSPTPNQDVFVHLTVDRQSGRIDSGSIVLYVTLTLTNARSAPIGLLSSCIVFSLWDTGGFLLESGAPPCILSNYEFAEVQPGQTYTIEKAEPQYMTVPKGLKADTYLLRAQYIRWQEEPNVQGTPVSGAQGDASGQAYVELN